VKHAVSVGCTSGCNIIREKLKRTNRVGDRSSDIARFFWCLGQVITIAAPNRNYELQKLKIKIASIYCISFCLDHSCKMKIRKSFFQLKYPFAAP
jgi:hypothetical protein